MTAGVPRELVTRCKVAALAKAGKEVGAPGGARTAGRQVAVEGVPASRCRDRLCTWWGRPLVAQHGLSASPRPDSSRFFRIGVRDPEGQCWRRGEWRFGDRAVRGRARAAG